MREVPFVDVVVLCTLNYIIKKEKFIYRIIVMSVFYRVKLFVLEKNETFSKSHNQCLPSTF